MQKAGSIRQSSQAPRAPAALCALGLLAACGGGEPELSDAAELGLRVEYAGCVRLLVGPVCVPGADGLRLWVQTLPEADIRVESEQGRYSPESRFVQAGKYFELQPAAGARTLSVHARHGRAESVWRLALSEARASGPHAAARSRMEQGELGSARELLLDALPDLAVDERGQALGLLARIALRSGDPARAQQHLREAIAAHREAGDLLGEIDDSTVLVYLLMHRGRDFAAAAAVLDALPVPAQQPAEAHYYRRYYRGLLALNSGDLRGSLRELEAAARQAERVGLSRLRHSAELMLAMQLQRLGRRQEAFALLARLQEHAPMELGVCERAQLLNNLAWSRLLALEAGESAEDPSGWLQQAFEIFTGDCANWQAEQVNVLLNLALAQLHAGRRAEAGATLARAHALDPEPAPRLALWSMDIEARLALAAGRSQDALASFEELARAARLTSSPSARWRAEIGRALTLEQMGQRESALAAFAEAERALERGSSQAPLQEGRESFLARHAWATRRHLELLLAEGREAQALAVARRARTRSLRSLRREERLATLSVTERERWYEAVSAYRRERDRLDREAAGDWRLAADRLAVEHSARAETERSLARLLDDAFAMLDQGAADPVEQIQPSPGELLLAYYPLQSDWVLFAQSAGGLRAHRLACADLHGGRRALADCLLGPIRTEIAASERLRILPGGALRELDFHALELDGEPLIAAIPIVYGLDLHPVPAVGGDTAGRALLVADARGDLPAAREEARLVADTLRAAGWTLEILHGETADAAALRERLPEVDLFHFAGHAVFAGRSGWDSVLPLARGSVLSVGDILALERAPRWIVLSGCETGRTAAELPAESIGLAQAFLGRGSHSVLATARPVADSSAAALVDMYYREWSQAGSPERALRAAQLALRDRQPDADWASFRIIEN